MTNIRIFSLKLISNTEINIQFTSNIGQVDTSNIIIESVNGFTKNLEIFSITSSEKLLKINTSPMIDGAYYKLSLISNSINLITGSLGESFIEDGTSNVKFFIGIQETNTFRDNLLNNIPSNYNKNSDSIIYSILNNIAKETEKSSNMLGEAKSASYVSILIENEEIIRGEGPGDRLANEGAFQLIKVRKNKLGTILSNTEHYDKFPSYVVSLQQQLISGETVNNSEASLNKFSGLIIDLINKPVIRVTEIKLIKNNITYTYDIERYKYGVLNNKYDENSYLSLDLQNNQIKLNPSAIGNSFPFPGINDSFQISYYYKDQGRIINSDSINIYKIVSIVRETVPAVITSFYLNHAPIVNENGDVYSLNGISWLDPKTNFTTVHPSFTYEILYSQSTMPSQPGQFSVNYETGQVFVYGTDGTDGTTVTPPTASYKFMYKYQENIDYVFYSDLNEIASLPNGELRDNESYIYNEFEETFANGVDFNFNSHIEVINERVNNQVIGNFGIKTQKYPITNVFRIYNETTGEIYTLNRIDGNNVYFNYTNAPEILEITKEVSEFLSISEYEMLVLDTFTKNGLQIYKIQLSNTRIASAFGNKIGNSFNSSVNFSEKDKFINEYYFNDYGYDAYDNLQANLNKLTEYGNYLIDYLNGTIYLASNYEQDTLGSVVYKIVNIKTKNNHVTSVNNVYRLTSYGKMSNIYDAKVINDNEIYISDIEQSGEKEYLGLPIVINSSIALVSSDISKLFHIYQVTDLDIEHNPIDFSSDVTFSSNTITFGSFGSKVIDTNNLIIQSSGSRQYIEAKRIEYLFSSGLATIVPTSPISIIDIITGQDYFSFGSDGYAEEVGNKIRIYLPSGSSGLVGKNVYATYYTILRDGAAILVDYDSGNLTVDYEYLNDELLISYEYGDNVIDWSISNSVLKDEKYYVSYRYGALREPLVNNFGTLTGLSELSVLPQDFDRETYRHALMGALQSFPNGPTIPSIKNLVKSMTEIEPEIKESAFFEWILGRDFLYPEKAEVLNPTNENIFYQGKFNNGLYFSKDGQSLIIPANSNIRFNEGTFETFIISSWNGIENDANLFFDLSIDGYEYVDKIFIGNRNIHPESIPFSLNKDDINTIGIPSLLHKEYGYFIWFNVDDNSWKFRIGYPKDVDHEFNGLITTDGEFYNIINAKTADAYVGIEGNINELTDNITSTDKKIKFSFNIDGYDLLNSSYDSYDSYLYFDGIDFSSDKLHYIFDTGISENYCRMSLFKDGKGNLKFRVFDGDKKANILSYNIKNWKKLETHFLACSWKIGTLEQRDELHLFVDGEEVPNTYRYGGYFLPEPDAYFMDEVSYTLLSSITSPIVGGFDLITTSGSNIVASNKNFYDLGVAVNSKFEILDDSYDGSQTMIYPYAYVKAILSQNSISLKNALGNDFILSLNLTDVKYSINPTTISIPVDNDIEKVRVFEYDGYDYNELYPENSLIPQYYFEKDGYSNYVKICDGININNSIILKSYGLMQSRYKQNVYIWTDLNTNILKTIMPQPININKINIIHIILKKTFIEATVGSLFLIMTTDVGGHLVEVLTSSFSFSDFCQPSQTITGKKLNISVFGDNIDWTKSNSITIEGIDYSLGMISETILFNNEGNKITQYNYVSINSISAVFYPKNPQRRAGIIEIKETYPLNWQENNGNYAKVCLSAINQNGNNGVCNIGEFTIADSYADFTKDLINSYFVIKTPVEISGTYNISDVILSDGYFDGNILLLSKQGFSGWANNYNDVSWDLLTKNEAESGFANGLITLETYGSAGMPFLLRSCWYEIDFPTFLTIPWPEIPNKLYIGSDMNSKNQVNGIIDELRILDEISIDTGKGYLLPSSGRSITTDYYSVKEFSSNVQTLCLFHFNNDVINYASFYSSFSDEYIQSENSVNNLFKQSAVFNQKKSLKIDNKSIFGNDAGTIEFWISPILDTYNDPTKRYYIDLASEQSVTLNRPSNIVSNLKIILPFRVRSILSVKTSFENTNYFTGGNLESDGITINLGQPIKRNIQTAIITYVPLNNQGDRFSIYKDESNCINLLVTASGKDFQIRTPIYWKKNTWHRVFAGWDLNNTDNNDRLVLIVDGTEGGVIRYGTGLKYGDGSLYGMPTVWGSANAGTTIARNLLSNIDLIDNFNIINIGSDFSDSYPAMAKFDNLRISSELRQITYVGGEGNGKLIGKDTLYTSNLSTALPVISDSLTRLLLDFDSENELIEYFSAVWDSKNGIFDFYVDVFDSFRLINTDVRKNLLVNLIKKLKPAHTISHVNFSE